MENMPEFQSHVSSAPDFFKFIKKKKKSEGVNKSSANTISNKLNIFLREDENCNIVSVHCTVNRCGEKTLMAPRLGGRREPMSTAVASERRLERRAT